MDKKRILVCDDDKDISDLIKIILNDHGYEVRLVTRGKEIIGKAIAYRPHLILLDIWMPGIDGREAARILKSDPKTKQIPIIAISALNETKKIAEEIGSDGFLRKPFDMDELLAIVAKYS